jgi:predicted transcriptional regulator
MPKRIYDDEELKKKGLELRKKGMSYRQIAKELGCSLTKIYYVLSPFEPKNKLKEAIELAEKVNFISRKIDEINNKLSNIESKEISLNDINKEIKGLKRDFISISSKLNQISSDHYLLRYVLIRNIKDRIEGESKCEYIDEEGYCKAWKHNIRFYKNMKEIDENGKKAYLLNVKEFPYACISCPKYRPKVIHIRL